MTFFVVNIMRATGTRLDPQLCALVERISIVAGQALASVCSYNFSRRRSWSLSSLALSPVEEIFIQQGVVVTKSLRQAGESCGRNLLQGRLHDIYY